MMLEGSSELVTAVGQGGTSPEFGEGRHPHREGNTTERLLISVHHAKERLGMHYS